jgi:hypothetical protein
VKRDKEQGYVELELKDDPKNHILRREMEKATDR